MIREIYTVYAQEADMTFIMIDSFDENDELMATECVGWYYGTPDEDNTRDFVGMLKADFN